MGQLDQNDMSKRSRYHDPEQPDPTRAASSCDPQIQNFTDGS